MASSDPPRGPGWVPTLSALLEDLAEAPALTAPTVVTPGQRIAGRFEVARELGRGGFGVVVEARDTVLGRPVALKFIRAGRPLEAPAGPALAEAEAISRLSHPNILHIHDRGTSEAGPFLVLELLEGEPLARRLKRGPVELGEAVRIALAAARGVAHAHVRGVIHRDLKPSNVFLCADGQVKVLDFGLAHLCGRPIHFEGGTPGWLAPEQLRQGVEDERTDVWALGAILFRMLSGADPSAGGLHLPGAPDLEALVESMLEQDPERRPRDAAHVVEALEPITRRLGARPAPAARRPLRLVAVLATLALVAGGGLVARLLLGRVRHGDAAREAVPSIAVLPFANLSSDPEQEYFSDGVAEEILNALAQVKGLRVAGRSSSFHFKGRADDLRAVAETLGVTNVLEGSIRKQGNRVRITAELVQGSDGFHRWSHTYDGDLTDVFEVQERIARAITDELAVVLTDGQRARLVPVATSNPEAYALYLQATAVLDRRDYPRMGEAIGWLEQALRLDPAFARAHARLALIHALGRAWFGSSPEECARHARLASQLDPTLAEPWVALGVVAFLERRFLEGRVALDRALELAPDDAILNLHYAQLLVATGYTRLGIARLDRALAIDPVLPNALWWRGLQYSYAGDQEAAERAFQRSASLGLTYADIGLAEVARARGDFARARSLIPTSWVYRTRCLADPATEIPVVLAGGLGGDAVTRERARAIVERCLAARPRPVPAWATGFYLSAGEPERARAVIASGVSDNEGDLLSTFWSPRGLPARRAPGFGEFARKVGYADLWERYGEPDGCRRVAARDYVCE